MKRKEHKDKVREEHAASQIEEQEETDMVIPSDPPALQAFDSEGSDILANILKK